MEVGGADLYTTADEVGLLRVQDPLGDSPQYFDITEKVQLWRHQGMVGDVRGVHAWNGYILILCTGLRRDTASAFPRSYPVTLPDRVAELPNCRLILYDPSKNTTHIVSQFELADPRGLAVNAAGGSIYAYGWDGDAGTALASIRATQFEWQHGTRYVPFDERDDVIRLWDGLRERYTDERYEDEGWFTTAWLDFGYAADEKIFDAIRCEYRTRFAGGGLRVEYRTERDVDHADSAPGTWHLAGEMTAMSDRLRQEDTIKADLDAPIRFDRIRFRFTLLGLTKLEQVVMTCHRVLGNRRGYDLRLETSPTPDAQDTATLRALESLRKTDLAFKMIPNPARLSWLDADMVRFRTPGLSMGTVEVLQAVSGLTERRVQTTVSLLSAGGR